jgi:acyl-CoA synthetase (AMP-forming)/AMP-acid ligase II/acyl carrier protein
MTAVSTPTNKSSSSTTTSSLVSTSSDQYPFLLDRLEEHATKNPHKTVFSFLSPGLQGGRISASLTYQELQIQTTQLAQKLLLQQLPPKSDGYSSSTLQPGDRALLVYPPSLDYVVAFLACLKAGIVAVPVFPPHPSRKDTLRMFATITASCQATVVLTNTEYNHFKKVSLLKTLFTTGKKKTGAEWPDHLPWIVTTNNNNNLNNNKTTQLSSVTFPTIQSTDLAFLQYTSGSTSEPKGVMITHGNLAHNLTIITRELKAHQDTTIVVSWLPQYHDMGLIGSYLGVLYCGGKGYYMSPLSFLQRPMIWIEAVSKYHATHLQAPNFAFRLTARKFQPSEYYGVHQQPSLQLQSVQHIINAAEPVDPTAIQSFYQAFTPFGLGQVIYPTYGLAEHTVFVCSGGQQTIQVQKEQLQMQGIVKVITDPTYSNETSPTTTTTLVGCGYPSHQQVHVKIVNRETNREMPIGHVGEIWINSPSKAAGYYGKLEETKQDFHATIFRDDENSNNNNTNIVHETYLRTGDLGFFYRNELFICGRIKDLIIVAGRNYYPQDLEATAEATSPTLLRPGCSAAFTIDPPIQGGEEVALIMELRENVPSTSNQPDIVKICDPLADQVRSAITQEHSLSISQIIFLRTKTVPKTSSGKIARAWCRKGFLAGTLQIVYQKSFPKPSNDDTLDAAATTTTKDAVVSPLEMETNDTTNDKAGVSRSTPLTQEQIDELRAMNRNDIMNKLRQDVARTAQIPPDSIDNDTALVTILDSLNISQFKGRLESVYAVKISDEYLFGERVTLKKLAEVVKLGYAPDDTVDHAGGDIGGTSSSSIAGPTGKAEGLAGALGCPPGVRVCCVIQ